jgi:hypothetical protein
MTTTEAPPPPRPPSAGPDRSPRPPRDRVRSTLPPNCWRAISVFGLFVAVTFTILPVGAHFGDDPLLRLRDLSPELSPPNPSVSCGSAVRSLNLEPRDTSLFELARARACEKAAKRRVATSGAVGAIVVMLGALGMRGGIPPRRTDASSG